MYGDSDESFLNTLYKEQTIIEMYAPDGFANKATGICHYCTVDTLKAILNKECLRFSDVRFLNDSTEHIHVPFQQILMRLVCGIIMPNLEKEST